MKRVIVGLSSLFFLLALVVLIVPLLLPKEAIRAELISRIEASTGWRLRLDGPVSLSLLPGFRMTAEDVGIAGAAGADGVEFARAAEIDFGLAWGSSMPRINRYSAIINDLHPSISLSFFLTHSNTT